MAQKIVHFRSTIPERLADIVSSASLALLRPELPLVLTSVASQSTGEGPQSELTGSSSSLSEAGEMELEKLYDLKKKAMSSMTEAPFILKRLNDCLARINKLEQNNVDIHSPFKRRKK
ncbi:uncharacterized protein LOC110039530 [Phalaenopsis equestris]|uniref:uncharacterized protein LOC110039530 n=1 Tax=Phalaenopsis equestris TaxID=78828 RepID=UPI0009E32BC7|nr:uncharacterized protein LOC110039530 [Phalaenopsis equestris]